MEIERVIALSPAGKLAESKLKRERNPFYKHRWSHPFFLIILVLVMIGSLTGCGGYHTFSSRIKQLDFIFEYPGGWRVAMIEQYSELVYAHLIGPNVSEKESQAKASFDVHLGKGEKADQEAQRISNGRLSADKDTPNYTLIRQEITDIDGYKGYLVEYTYDHVSLPMGPSSWFFIPTRVLDITIPRNGMVYEIWLSASQNEWNARDQEFQHILDTFHWK